MVYSYSCQVHVLYLFWQIINDSHPSINKEVIKQSFMSTLFAFTSYFNIYTGKGYLSQWGVCDSII